MVRCISSQWSIGLTEVALCDLVNEHGNIRACNVTTSLHAFYLKSLELFDLCHCSWKCLVRSPDDELHVTDGKSTFGNPSMSSPLTSPPCGACFACSPA
jgi:hypothetical protein